MSHSLKPGAGRGASLAPPTGPVVTRRVPGAPGGAGAASTRIARLKPSIRETIDSVVSTGSQAEWFKPEQSIIIFDWDDTLCPSTWIRENRLSFFRPAPPEERYRKPLRELTAKVSALLAVAMKLGKVIIVTNAMEPWIETSCRNFLPELWPTVSTIPLIYARSIYETQTLDPPRGNFRGANGRSSSPGNRAGALPGLYTANGQNKLGNLGGMRMTRQVEIDPQAWKEVAFVQELTGFYSRYKNQSWKNVISIGDAIFERDAVRRVVLTRPTANKRCRTKTVKLLDDPDIQELNRQLLLIKNMLTVAAHYNGDLEVEIDEEDLALEESLLDKVSMC